MKLKLILLSAIAAISMTVAQSISPAPAFEVASVKVDTSNSTGVLRYSPPLTSPDGPVAELTIRGYPLDAILAMAYGIPMERITFPSSKSAGLVRYAIAAKAANPVSKTEFMVMLQGLLADRLKLVVHREKRNSSVYALIVDRKGPKLSRAGVEGNYLMRYVLGDRYLSGQMSMSRLASSLAFGLDRPVIDSTGIGGFFDIKLNWTVNSEESSATPLPSVFTAVRECGLRLEAQRAPLEFLVVDRVERDPSDN